MTIVVSINGKPAGKVIFSPGGVPWIDPILFSVLRHMPGPVPLLPNLNPQGTLDALLSLQSQPTTIPGIGVISTQRLG